MTALRRLSPPDEAELQMQEMAAISQGDQQKKPILSGGSLLRRKYVIPFVLACTILACNQATAINSILGFLVVILKQAGMSPRHATLGDVIVKVLNCLMTVIAVALVDKKRRKLLLKIGIGGVVLSLLGCAIVFYVFESRRADIKVDVRQALHGNELIIPLRDLRPGEGNSEPAMSLTVLYSYGFGDKVATAVSSESDAALNIAPDTKEAASPLVIKRALYGPCTLVYFITATFFLPETKGKTLEEIEEYFEGRGRRALTRGS